MSDPIIDEKIEEDENFANLLESYESSSNDDIRIGDQITGEILSIGMDTLFINTGTKIDGAVEKQELLDDNQELPYKVGDKIDLYVVSVNEHEIKLSKALSGTGSANQLQDAFHMSVPVEGKVKEKCKGGFNVEIMQQRAFCPISQMDTRFVQNPDEYLGNTYHFKIIKFEEGGRNIVVSRRQILMQEQEAAKADFFKDHPPDTIVEGKVTRLMPYGVFVEMFPGLEGMVHISEISWSRVEDIQSVLKEGDVVKAKILSIEDGKKPGQHKIGLSIKQVEGSPWDKEMTVKVGDRFKAIVKKCMNFGAFVEISPGVEGLVHISEMSYVKRILKPEDVVSVGETVDVVVKSIDQDNKKIALSMKDAAGDPWIDVNNKFSVGQILEGTIERKEKYGYFVSLVPGVTGLMPVSAIKKIHNPSRIERLNIGEKLNVAIKEINASERRISLAPEDGDENEKNWEQFSTKSKSKSKTTQKDSASNNSSDFSDQLKKLKMKFS